MAFDGLAAYDDFSIIGEDVSDILRLISPTETPLLARLPRPDRPVTNVYHEWTEEELGPDFITNSTAISSATAATGIQINGFGNQLQVGMLLEIEVASGNQELVQISSIPGANSILVTRNYGSRGINSLAAGGQLFVVAPTELEGSETSGDVTRVRTRRDNFTQIFKKAITVSGTRQAVVTAPNVGSEFDHQVLNRVRELARDLEKAVVRSARSGSSIGSDTAYRSMDGLRQYITNINSTIASTSFAAAPLTYLNDLLQQTYIAGARDLDILYVGSQWKREISATNASVLQVTQDERGIERLVDFVQTDFGNLRVLLSPWLPQRQLMMLASSRIMVKPLRGRSFQREDLAKTGDSIKGHVVGEYSLEVHHPDKMAQARTSG